jgi:hypothetical protein
MAGTEEANALDHQPHLDSNLILTNFNSTSTTPSTHFLLLSPLQLYETSHDPTLRLFSRSIISWRCVAS